MNKKERIKREMKEVVVVGVVVGVRIVRRQLKQADGSVQKLTK